MEQGLHGGVEPKFQLGDLEAQMLKRLKKDRQTLVNFTKQSTQ
jgi:hypothetical protein